MTIVIVAQVICRTFFGFSIFWAEELSRYCLTWVTFVGASMALRNADLVALDLIEKKMKGQWKWFLQLFIEILVFVFILIAIVYGLKQAFSPSIINQVSPALRLPMPIVYISIPVGFTFMLIHSIRSCFQLVKSRKENTEW